MSFISKIEKEVRRRNEISSRRPLSDISSSCNISKPVIINRDKNKSKTNLSNLVKIKTISKPNSREKEQTTTSQHSSIFEIARRPKIGVALELDDNDEKHSIFNLSLSNSNSAKSTKTSTRRDLRFEIPENDPMLSKLGSLTGQAFSGYKLAINWFEATNFKYASKELKDFKGDESLLTIQKFTKFNDFSYFAELTTGGDDETAIKVMLNRLRCNQVIESVAFDDDALDNLISKKIVLSKFKDGELQIDADIIIPCYSKWHIYV